MSMIRVISQKYSDKGNKDDHKTSFVSNILIDNRGSNPLILMCGKVAFNKRTITIIYKLITQRPWNVESSYVDIKKNGFVHTDYYKGE